MNFKKYRIAIIFFFIVWIILLLSFHPIIHGMDGGADGLGGFIPAIFLTLLIIVFGIGFSSFLLAGLLNNRSRKTCVISILIAGVVMLNVCLHFTWRLSFVSVVQQFIY